MSINLDLFSSSKVEDPYLKTEEYVSNCQKTMSRYNFIAVRRRNLMYIIFFFSMVESGVCMKETKEITREKLEDPVLTAFAFRSPE